MILIIGHDASLTGAPILLYNFIKWLKEEKKEDLVILLKSNGPLLDKYCALAKTYIWNEKPIKRTLSYRIVNKFINLALIRKRKIINLILKEKPGLILSNTVVNGDIIEQLKPYDIPVINWVHELENVIQQYNKYEISAKSLKYSDQFIAISDCVRKNLVENHAIDNAKINVVYNGILKIPDIKDARGTKASLGIAENNFVVGACGTLLWRKGFDLYIRMAYELIKTQKLTDLYFIWIGGNMDEAPFNQYTEEIKKLGLQENFKITGETTDPYQYYQILDVFCMTSREEPFGLVMLEAASCGIPILCFDQSGFPQEFITPDVGFVSPYADFEKMSEKIIYLKDHPDIRATLSKNIKKKSEDFSFDNMANQIFDILKEASK